MNKMKSALIGLLMGGLGGIGQLMLRNLDGLESLEGTFKGRLVRKVRRASRYRPTFNGRQPSVKRANRQAKAVRAQRRARRLGHA